MRQLTGQDAIYLNLEGGAFTVMLSVDMSFPTRQSKLNSCPSGGCYNEQNGAIRMQAR